MPKRKLKQLDTPKPIDAKTAAHLAQGLTLVPYYAYNEHGERCAYCAWIKLKHGESIAQAASRLSDSGAKAKTGD